MMPDLSIEGPLRNLIRSNLLKFELSAIASADHRQAAVAVVVLDQQEAAGIGDIPFNACDEGRAAVLLTIRAAKLKDHAGQRAFPGGRLDEGETVEQAALRELQEEVGLQLDAGSVLGRLDDYATRSGFVISPVVVWGGRVGELTANPDEVESLHRIPVSELLREDAPRLQYKKDREHPVLKMPLGNDWFAAPTAAIAYQFREVAILGKDTRVAHFDQPKFAWS